MSITVAASKVPMVKESESAKVTTFKDSEAKNNAIPFVSGEKLHGSGDSVELSKTSNPAPQEEKGVLQQVWDGVKTLYKGVTSMLDAGDKMTTAEEIDSILGTSFSPIVDGQKQLKTASRSEVFAGYSMSDVDNRAMNSVMMNAAMNSTGAYSVLKNKQDKTEE